MQHDGVYQTSIQNIVFKIKIREENKSPQERRRSYPGDDLPQDNAASLDGLLQ